MAINNIENQPKLLTKKEVAAIYKCSLKTVDNMMKLNMIKYHKLGSLVRFRTDELPILNSLPKTA
jgi:excisionase family DNA binding protein